MLQTNYEDYVSTFPTLEGHDEETKKVWEKRHRFRFIDQMSDAWGEADKCVRLKNQGEYKKLEAQIRVFVNTVDAILTDPKLSKGTKYELRGAEWEILDYCIGDNEWKNKDKTAMKWFDQWMFDYNFDLR